MQRTSECDNVPSGAPESRLQGNDEQGEERSSCYHEDIHHCSDWR